MTHRIFHHIGLFVQSIQAVHDDSKLLWRANPVVASYINKCVISLYDYCFTNDLLNIIKNVLRIFLNMVSAQK